MGIFFTGGSHQLFRYLGKNNEMRQEVGVKLKYVSYELVGGGNATNVNMFSVIYMLHNRVHNFC